MQEAWSLWVDSKSFDPEAIDKQPPGYDWVVAASNAKEAIMLIDELGPPCFIDLDDDELCKDVVRHLYQKHSGVEIGFRVRSPNSVVGSWLYNFMYSWHQIHGFHHEGKYNGI